MFKIYIEDGDFGQDGYLFSTVDKAKEWMAQVIEANKPWFTFEDYPTDTVESLEKEGYIEIVSQEIDPVDCFA